MGAVPMSTAPIAPPVLVSPGQGKKGRATCIPMACIPVPVSPGRGKSGLGWRKPFTCLS